MKIVFSVVVSLAVLTQTAKAEMETMSDFLSGGWKIVSISKETLYPICPQAVEVCPENSKQASTVFHLVKDDGFAFCIGSYFWNGDAEQWVCRVNKQPGNS